MNNTLSIYRHASLVSCSPNLQTGPPPFEAATRCFTLCEPKDLMKRDDKLMKPMVVHDGKQPTRFFLYLFPEEPAFGPEVGYPAYLTPYLRQGRLADGRERARVIGECDRVFHRIGNWFQEWRKLQG